MYLKRLFNDVRRECNFRCCRKMRCIWILYLSMFLKQFTGLLEITARTNRPCHRYWSRLAPT